MTVTAVRKDPAALTMTVDAEFDASAERVWQLWADPRQLERWWGPPTYPATVDAHDLRPGGRVDYHMTGPEGDQPRGYWEIVEVDPPHRLVFRDGFARDDGTPNDRHARDGGTGRDDRGDRQAGARGCRSRARFPSTEAMEQLMAMGMEEGLTEAHRPDRRDPRRGCRSPALTRRAPMTTQTTPTQPTTHTLEVPGATLTYDVRRNADDHRADRCC